MARPNKSEAIAKRKRDKKMLMMIKKGYPADYISAYFGLTKGRVSQILKKVAEENKQKGL